MISLSRLFVLHSTVIEKFLIVIIALATALTGYMYTSFFGNKLVSDYEIRAVVLICLLLLSLICLSTLSGQIKLPIIGFVYFLPILYMEGVGLIILPPQQYASSIIRWLIYAMLGLYFYNVSNPIESFKIFIGIFGFLLILQGVGDWLIGRGIFINNAFRIGGGVGSPIGFAGALFITGFCAFYIWIRGAGGGGYLFISLASTVIIILTGTRSLFFAYAVTLSGFFIIHVRGVIKKIVSCFSIAVFLALIMTYVVFKTDLGARFLFNSLSQDSSASFRFFLLETIVQQFDGFQAIFGTGLGGFPALFFRLTGLEGVAPHFEFIWVLVEGGVIGSAIYLACFVVVFYYLVAIRIDGKVDKTNFWFLLILSLSPQFAFQFANPNYFYQMMIPLVVALSTNFSNILGSKRNVST